MALSPSSTSKPIHILFVGAGAVGCFYASRLHAPKSDIYVSLVCRSNYTAIVRSGVLLHTHTFGSYVFVPHAVYPSITTASTSPLSPKTGWDYVVVTTKALPDITDDSLDIAPLIEQGKTCVFLIQNGFGVEVPHRKRFPMNPIVSGVTVVSAEQVSQGVIRQNRWTRISMGAYSDGLGGKSGQMKALCERGNACVKELARIFAEHGRLRDAEPHEEVELQQVRWHKICINAAFNPSAVLAGRIGNAEMAFDPDLREHLKGVMNEVFAAAPAVLGRGFPDSLAKPDQILRSTERNVGSKPSMLLDWEAGRPMELEVILGNSVRIAKERGVEMPRLQTLYALLKSAQRKRSKL